MSEKRKVEKKTKKTHKKTESRVKTLTGRKCFKMEHWRSSGLPSSTSILNIISLSSVLNKNKLEKLKAIIQHLQNAPGDDSDENLVMEEFGESSDDRSDWLTDSE